MDPINKKELIDYISGKLSAKEEKRVEEWVIESDDNREILKDLYLASKITEQVVMMKTVDTEKSLLELDMILKKKQKKRIFNKYFALIQRAAAILFIPVLILAALWYPSKDSGQLSHIEIKANRGTTSSFILPDCTKVWLNAGSKMEYPTLFGKDCRVIKLEGEALFHVRENKEKPFIVKSDANYSVEVLGTIFNVYAYSDEDIIETTLIDGAVKLKYKTPDKKVTDLFLRPNEKAVYSKKNCQMEIIDVEGSSVAAWKHGQIIFNGHPMSHVIKVLARHYNIEFNIIDEKVYNTSLTGTFDNEQLTQVLKYIELATGIKYRISNPLKDKPSKSIIELYI